MRVLIARIIKHEDSYDVAGLLRETFRRLSPFYRLKRPTILTSTALFIYLGTIIECDRTSGKNILKKNWCAHAQEIKSHSSAEKSRQRASAVDA